MTRDEALELLVDDMLSEDILAIPGVRAAMHAHLVERVDSLLEERQTVEVDLDDKLADWADRQRD